MPCLKTFVASIRVSRAREVSRPRPSLGGDPEDRRHQKRNGKRRSPDPELGPCAGARPEVPRGDAARGLETKRKRGRRTYRTNESCGGLQDVPSVLGRGNLFGLFISVPDWCAVRGALIGRSLCQSVWTLSTQRKGVCPCLRNLPSPPFYYPTPSSSPPAPSCSSSPSP